MDVIALPSEVRTWVQQCRREQKTIGVVPTMGALHAGHLSLVEAARADCDVVITTIFVNPTQFGPGEDFDQYPRTLDADLELCRQAGSDLVFTPDVDTMYGSCACTTVSVSGVTEVLEGACRPDHFDGVTTVVSKLFNITQPDRAYFGQKDYQQQLVIRHMVRDLNWPIEVVTCPIVREADGLAMSSRNRYLSPEQRTQALALNRCLQQAADLAAEGQTAATIQESMQQQLLQAHGVQLDYAVVAGTETLQPATAGCRQAVALVAARLGPTRLIDNCVLTFAGQSDSLSSTPQPTGTCSG